MSQTAPIPELQPIEQLQSLEDRIVSVVQLLKETRAARQQAESESAALRATIADLEGKLHSSAETVAATLATRDSELAALRQQAASAQAEREEVRRRLEKLLRQIDALSE
jgi:chromosome segregation ATPase